MEQRIQERDGNLAAFHNMDKVSDYIKEHFPLIEHMKEVTRDRYELAHNRIEICKTCDSYNKTMKMCTECYCIAPAKALGNGQSCPIGKW